MSHDATLFVLRRADGMLMTVYSYRNEEQAVAACGRLNASETIWPHYKPVQVAKFEFVGHITPTQES